MTTTRSLFRMAALSLPLALSGCLWHTRRLPIPKPPESIESVTPEELVAQVNDRWEKLQTLSVKVQIEASVEKTQQGVARDYTSFRGVILLRKPNHLRVLGLYPFLNSTMFDMATNGSTFRLYIPGKNKLIEGSNTVKKKSDNQYENLRPEFFYDAMAVRGLDPDNTYSVTGDSETIEDVSKKHLSLMPEYVLNITRPKAGSREETPVRVIEFHRDDLLPYQQDLYDEKGNLATHVTYTNYKRFDFGMYPTTITIKRPLENFQLVLTVTDVTQNVPLADNQFEVKPKADTPVQRLD